MGSEKPSQIRGGGVIYTSYTVETLISRSTLNMNSGHMYSLVLDLATLESFASCSYDAARLQSKHTDLLASSFLLCFLQCDDMHTTRSGGTINYALGEQTSESGVGEKDAY